MKNNILHTLVSGAIFSQCCLAILITASNDALAIAGAIFNAGGVTVNSASFLGATDAAGIFTEGPFGIGSGGILTTGTALDALIGGNDHVDNGAAGSTTYCGANTNDASVLTVDITVSEGYSGIQVQLILASQESGGGYPDPIAVFLDGTQYAYDSDGGVITGTGIYLQSPNIILSPNSDTSYYGSSPPLLFSIPAASGDHTVVIAVCDEVDHGYDSGLMINAGGCSGDNCQPTIKVNYVTTTTTVDAGSSSYTSTIQGLHTTSGTIIFGVEGVNTNTAQDSTTILDSTTIATQQATATSYVSSATSDASSTTLDASSIISEASSTTPDASSTTPDASSTTPDASSTILDTSSIISETISATLDVSSTTPDASSITSDTSSATLDASSTILDASSIISDTSSATLDASSTILDASSIISDTSSATLDASSITSDTSSAILDASSATSDASITTSDASTSATPSAAASSSLSPTAPSSLSSSLDSSATPSDTAILSSTYAVPSSVDSSSANGSKTIVEVSSITAFPASSSTSDTESETSRVIPFPEISSTTSPTLDTPTSPGFEIGTSTYSSSSLAFPTGPFYTNSSSSAPAAPTETTFFLTVSPAANNPTKQKRQVDVTYVGPGGQLSDTCGPALAFTLADGQLSSGGSLISTSPSYPAIQVFATQIPTGISTTFSVLNGVLQWNVDSTPVRSALFCIRGNAMQVVFDGNLPIDCTLVVVSVAPPTCPGVVTTPGSTGTVTASGSTGTVTAPGSISTVSVSEIALPSVPAGQAIGVIIIISISIIVKIDINDGTAVTITSTLTESSCPLYATATSTQPCYVCQLAAQGQTCPAFGVTVTETVCGSCGPQTTFPAVIQTCPTCVAQTLTATVVAGAIATNVAEAGIPGSSIPGVTAEGNVVVPSGGAGGSPQPTDVTGSNSTGSVVTCNGDSCSSTSSINTFVTGGAGKSMIATSVAFVATIMLVMMALLSGGLR